MSLRPAGKFVRLRALDDVCSSHWQCATRSFTHSFAPRNPVVSGPNRLKARYFLSNGLLPKLQKEREGGTRRWSTSATTEKARNGAGKAYTATATAPAPASISHINKDIAHRRPQAAKRKAAADAALLAQSISTEENALPAQDAASVLTTAATKQPANSLRRQLSLYLSLSKPRLTVLVVLSAMSSYALYPVPDFLAPTIGLDTPSLSPLTLAFLTTGTALCSASANAFNMLYEPRTDAQMSRTRNRPLVRRLLSTRKAMVFAVMAAVVGTGALYFGVNPTVAFLGTTNIFLYAGIYTPMKQMHWLNTWVGAIVGGIPPLMGWAAAAGEVATGTGSFQELLFTSGGVGGWLLAALLFAWQFPHFMALSWPIREEYKAAGHKMLAWINPGRNARVALRYSLAFFPICFGLCYVGVTEWSFAVTSLPVNVWLTSEAVRFWQHEGHKSSARGLFWASVWHLPAIMVLALVQKKGMWARVWNAIIGTPVDDDEDDWEEYDDDDSHASTASSHALPSQEK